MNRRLLPLVAGLLAFVVPVHAAEAGAPAASGGAALSADPALDRQVEELVGRINRKLQAGPPSEAGLASELKDFDALIAAHKGEKSDAAAKAAFMRATLYAQVLENYDKAGELLQQLKTDFAGTEAAAAASEMLAQIDAQKESLRIQAALKPGAAFPDFQEKDLSGQPLSLARYKGKIVLVDFWATWCGPCVAELPNVLAAYQKYHDRGFEIVGISLDREEAKLKEFIAARKMPWAQYFDGQGWQSKLGRKYGVNSIPATYLLDKEGRIVAKNLRGPALDAELAKLLAK